VSRGGLGGPGGPRGGPSTNTTPIKYLEAHQGSAKYLVAATGSQTTAPIIIATGKPVVTIGGFNGSDSAPTVAQLAELVRSGQLRYVLLGGGGGPGGGNQAIQAWVQQHGTVVTGSLYQVSA
jgi:4-amino-4-deoxy-L-arabinose transferase-like glycosyltransferase